MAPVLGLVVVLLGVFVWLSVGNELGAEVAFQVELPELPDDLSHYAPLWGLPPMDVPEDQPLTPARVALGRLLFHDPRLDAAGTTACAGCHMGGGDAPGGAPTARAAAAPRLPRAPRLRDVGYRPCLRADPEHARLQDCVRAAWLGTCSGAEADLRSILASLEERPGYRELFLEALGEPAAVPTVVSALASWLRTYVSGSSPFDLWYRGDETAVTDGVRRGYAIFRRSECHACHVPPLFTDDRWRDADSCGRDGVARAGAPPRDAARAVPTPSLRNLGTARAWFHDASVASLEQGVELLLARHGPPDARALDDDELADLLVFLRSLDEPAMGGGVRLP